MQQDRATRRWAATRLRFRGASVVLLALVCIEFGYYAGGGADGAGAAWPIGFFLAALVLALVFLIFRPIEERLRTRFCVFGWAGFVPAAMLASAALSDSTDFAVRMGVVATVSIICMFGGFAVAAFLSRGAP
jgi:hypothetical protein